MSIDEHELPEGALLLEPRDTYDKAIVGYTNEAVVYDMDAVVWSGMEIFGDYEASLEWHDFNTFSTHMGEGTPIFMTVTARRDDEQIPPR